MLGVYVDSSLGTFILALWVHLSLLDFSVVKCILVVYSGTSGRVIVYEDFGSYRVNPLFAGRCSANDLSPLIGWQLGCIVAGAFVNPNGMTRYSTSMPGAKRDFVLIAFLNSDEMIGIPEVLSSISEISGTGYRFFSAAWLRARYSIHSRSPLSFLLVYMIPAAAADNRWMNPLVSFASM